MRKIESLESLSDGNLYDINSMVRIDTYGCSGCTDCCRYIDGLIEINPYDFHQMSCATNHSLDQLLQNNLQLITNEKVAVPYIKTDADTQACTFLNSSGLCSIHAQRPDICRLFPLGRVYQKDDYKYFFQVGACSKPKLGKVKIKRWLNIPQHKDYKTFILNWHSFLKALRFRLKFVHDDKELDDINNYILTTFYTKKSDDIDFYTWFNQQISTSKDKIGLL